jgi:hypothetical protein
MKAFVAICSSMGQETLTVNVDDYDLFIVLTVRNVTVQLTRDEARQVSDALRAAAVRYPYEDSL